MTDQTKETGSDRVAGTNLTTVAEYSQTALALASLQDRFKNLVVDVSTKKGLEAATKDVAELRTLRTSLEKRRKELKEPLLARGKVLDDEAKRLTAEISALEDPLKLQVDAKNAEIEQARLEKLEAERLRVEVINKRIDEIRNTPATMVGKPAVIIHGALARLKADEPSEDEFREHFVTARDAHTAAIARIEQLLAAQIEVDEEKKRQAQRDADMKAMQDKLDAQQKLIDEAAAVAKAEAERVAAEAAAAERAKQEAEAEAQRQRDADERERVEEIRSLINWFRLKPQGCIGLPSGDIIAVIEDVTTQPVDSEDYDEFEQEGIEAKSAALLALQNLLEHAIEQEQERAREQAEHATEALRQQAERERQAARQRDLDAQAAKLNREKAEAARKAEELRLASLGLREAAQAVVEYFAALTPSHIPQCVPDLAAALANDAAQAKPAREKKAANA